MTESKKSHTPDIPLVHHHKSIRRTIFISLPISVFVTGLGFVVFIQAVPYFEKQLFPSSQLIDVVKANLGTLTQKTEEIQKNMLAFEQTSEKVLALQTQVTGLQETVGQLLKNVAGLEEKFKQNQLAKEPISTVPVAPNTALKEKWLTIQTRFEKGEAFSDTLHELIPLLGEDRALLDALHQLTVYANGSVKPLLALADNLATIHNLVQKGKSTETSPEPEVKGGPGLWGLLVERLKGVVRITKEEDLAALEKNKEAQKGVLNALDKALKEVQKTNLEAALACIKPLAHEHTALLEPWVLDAEKRLALNNSFNAFKIKFESFLVRVS